MRKENTQKIHALPDKMFAILHNTKVSDDIPQTRIVDSFVHIFDAILTKIKN
jgi:hypothetical protein